MSITKNSRYVEGYPQNFLTKIVVTLSLVLLITEARLLTKKRIMVSPLVLSDCK